MKYRKLRIAWSVVWGMVALLLIVLWVRSYEKSDIAFYILRGRAIGVGSVCGSIALLTLPDDYGNEPGTLWTDTQHVQAVGRPFPFPPTLFLAWDSDYFTMAYWLPTLIAVFCTVLGAKPWLNSRFQFTLHTLLIATTLIAVVLGLTVWALHK